MKKCLLLILSISFCFAVLSSCGGLERVRREQFTVNPNSHKIPIGEIELQFDTFMLMRGLRKDNISVYYYPREDAVCLQYRHEFVNFHQFWSRRGRLEFISALDSYYKDYEERTLIVKNRNSKRQYSTVEGYLVWQMYTFTIQARANMNLELGYEFKDRAPYFTVNQRQAEFKEDHSRENSRTSPVVTMYFTRAQASELAKLFDHDFLQNVITPNMPAKQDTADRDDY